MFCVREAASFKMKLNLIPYCNNCVSLLVLVVIVVSENNPAVIFFDFFVKVVLKVCAAAQRSRNHGRTKDGFEWQVAVF